MAFYLHEVSRGKEAEDFVVFKNFTEDLSSFDSSADEKKSLVVFQHGHSTGSCGRIAPNRLTCLYPLVRLGENGMHENLHFLKLFAFLSALKGLVFYH